jgi:hypothetical protein
MPFELRLLNGMKAEYAAHQRYLDTPRWLASGIKFIGDCACFFVNVVFISLDAGHRPDFVLTSLASRLPARLP